MTILSGDEDRVKLKAKGIGLGHRVKVNTGIGGKVCNNLDCPDNENGRCKIFVKGQRCEMQKVK